VVSTRRERLGLAGALLVYIVGTFGFIERWQKFKNTLMYPLMKQILPIAQAILAVLLILGILFQRSDAGLGSAFGQDTFGGVKYEKRGAEKIIFVGTVIVAILFAISAFAVLFVK